jgi:hypothetical protein
MATHDYVIDNQTAPNFRADLNNALLAIVSQNSNATSPSVTYADMIWYETDTNTLWKRNEANSAWISMGVFDESLGTFTPSGERALSSQAQAEAGADNTTLMTPLRTEQAISFQVGTATAGLSLGSVGTYAWLGRVSAVTTFVAGTSYAGSNLRYSGTLSGNTFSDNTAASINGATPSGTWRAMGTANNVTDRYATTIFLRIS